MDTDLEKALTKLDPLNSFFIEFMYIHHFDAHFPDKPGLAVFLSIIT